MIKTIFYICCFSLGLSLGHVILVPLFEPLIIKELNAQEQRFTPNKWYFNTIGSGNRIYVVGPFMRQHNCETHRQWIKQQESNTAVSTCWEG